MTNNVKLSVVVLTYNCESYIEQAIESILAQKFRFKFEIVICDDFSTDRTKEILISKYNEHGTINIIFNEENIGIIANFRNAIINSKGKYIAYCGHDDFWHDTNKLQEQFNFLENNPAYGLVHTDYNILNSSTGEILKNVHQSRKTKISQGYISNDLIYGYYINSTTPCFRKDIYNKHVPINEFVKQKFPVEDWPIYITLSIFSKVGYINKSTATFRKGHESESNSLAIEKAEKYLEGHERMFNYLKNTFPLEFSRFSKFDFQVYKYKSLLSKAYKLQNFKKAKYYSSLLQKHSQRSAKIIFARYRVTFQTFLILKQIAFHFKKHLFEVNKTINHHPLLG